MRRFLGLVFLMGLPCFAQLDVAVIDLVSDTDQVRYQMRDVDFERVAPIRFFQAESVRFNVTAQRGGAPIVLTNANVSVRWEAYASLNSTNAFIHKPGVVSDASSGVARIELTPEEANLPAGTYYSYVRAFQEVNGTNVYVGVVAFNRLEVLWSPDANVYSYAGPFPVLDLSGAVGPQGEAGPAGTNGLSAYEVAVSTGFVGSANEWLATLVGPQGVDGVNGTNGLSAYEVAVSAGFVGNVDAWLASLVGAQGPIGISGGEGSQGSDGQSAYQVALSAGFVGSESAWLESLVGQQGAQGVAGVNGTNGLSAYEVAVSTGFVGNVSAWLATLVGAQGVQGEGGEIGPAGSNGTNGLSAYEVAVSTGFVGSASAWLATLVGPAGEPGAAGSDGVDGQDGADAMNSPWNVSTDTAWLAVGTNTIWIYATPNPTNTNYTAVGWIVSTTNATLLIGTNVLEVTP